MNTKNILIGIAVVLVLFFGWKTLYKTDSSTPSDPAADNAAAAALAALPDQASYTSTGKDAYTLRYPKSFSVNTAELAALGMPSTAFLISNAAGDCSIRAGFHSYGNETTHPFVTPLEKSTKTLGSTPFSTIAVRDNAGTLVVVNATARRQYTTPVPDSFYVTNYDRASGTYRAISDDCRTSFENILASYQPVSK
jgi:hypothetical protein